MNFPRNEFEAWALPHFSGGDAEAVIALMELDSKGGYRSDEMRAARDAWQQLAGQRDAMAAHVERYHAAYVKLTNSEPTEDADTRETMYLATQSLMVEFDAIAESQPTTSLERLIAEKQDEARLEFAKECARRHGGLDSIIEVAKSMNHWRGVEQRAKERRQAEGGE